MKIINWTIAILSTSLLFLVLLNIKSCKEDPNYNQDVKQLDKTIDSLEVKIDSLLEIEYDTKVKWRTKTIKEVEYIYLVADTLQPIIRDSLRTRYYQGR